ncbi:hypothetical protein HII31_05468 [Pseudocercospora fuligena]|uniref:T6SS Phospholipase effector Tle1-like catalytic domain-containing protein n=1 Tax=Pseudocercospora fuligena TaxID=685502 RepID=A0A8H6VK01_9PEZI|nr:hypothetical protein HII31_05468 [Pseudocercospora fuligena]
MRPYLFTQSLPRRLTLHHTLSMNLQRALLRSRSMSDLAEPESAGYKRLIICCDGTWLASNIGDSARPSNVARIARAISPNGLDAKNKVVKQIVSYHSGLGSGDLAIQKAIYAGGIGWGLEHDVTEVYDFIANNWEPDDEIFLFGFSRGAFTVRSAAGLVSNVGILPAVKMSEFDEMWTAYRSRPNSQPFKSSSWYRDNQNKLGLKEARVKVVGVWDTVGALGIPRWPIVSWLQKFGIGINRRHEFHDTGLSSNIEYAFQALALDEKRLTFPPTMWHKTKDGPAEDLQQCWFPGTHQNIGGQTETPEEDTDRCQIGLNTFAWMVDNLSKMLTFENNTIESLIEEHEFALQQNGIPNGWGCGRILDNFSGLQGKFFQVLGTTVRTPARYVQDAGSAMPGVTNESIHPMARIRKARLGRNWSPPALEDFAVPSAAAEGWEGRTGGVPTVPEYSMSTDKTMTVSYPTGTTPSFGTRKSLSRTLCPRELLP